MTTFETPISNFCAFCLKIDFFWPFEFNNVHAHLFTDRQFSLYFLMKIETTRLLFIDTYNKHFFTMLKIYIFAIFRHSSDVFFIHLFCLEIKIVK